MRVLFVLLLVLPFGALGQNYTALKIDGAWGYTFGDGVIPATKNAIAKAGMWPESAYMPLLGGKDSTLAVTFYPVDFGRFHEAEVKLQFYDDMYVGATITIPTTKLNDYVGLRDDMEAKYGPPYHTGEKNNNMWMSKDGSSLFAILAKDRIVLLYSDGTFSRYVNSAVTSDY